MKNYQLQGDEVVLYKGDITLQGQEQISQLILTNLNVVFISNPNEEDPDIEIFSVDDIKIYKDIPQIKAQKNLVEIYFVPTERVFAFKSKKELTSFMQEATNLLTGKSKFERCVANVKRKVDLVDNTFDIDTVDLVKSAVKNGATSAINKIAGLGKNLFKKKDKN